MMSSIYIKINIYKVNIKITVKEIDLVESRLISCFNPIQGVPGFSVTHMGAI